MPISDQEREMAGLIGRFSAFEECPSAHEYSSAELQAGRTCGVCFVCQSHLYGLLADPNVELTGRMLTDDHARLIQMSYLLSDWTAEDDCQEFTDGTTCADHADEPLHIDCLHCQAVPHTRPFLDLVRS